MAMLRLYFHPEWSSFFKRSMPEKELTPRNSAINPFKKFLKISALTRLIEIKNPNR